MPASPAFEGAATVIGLAFPVSRHDSPHPLLVQTDDTDDSRHPGEKILNTQLSMMLDRACRATAPAVGVGKTAQYIPALARIDPAKFGAAIVTVDGDIARFGDADEPFSIQSISKVFTLTMALRRVGEELWKRVGREPSGSAFNSIMQLERESGVPRNPLINAGALVVCDVLLATSPGQPMIEEILTFIRDACGGKDAYVDPEVAESERATGYRNASLANFVRSFGNLDRTVEEVLEVYFNQCAIAMSCTDLARAALYLASDGIDPLTNRSVISRNLARRVKSIMLMCGHYDASGDFAYRVGLPAKSGVGGGIVAVAPFRAAIAVWSPCLNESGNSHAGTVALEQIVRETGWSVF